jgi:hypothetical protein
MKTPPVDAPLHNKTLTEQKADFTAEGSPSPGNVAGSVPPVIEPNKDLAPTSDSRCDAKKGTTGP